MSSAPSTATQTTGPPRDLDDLRRRVVLAVVATTLVAVPFTILLLAVTTRSDWLARMDSVGTDQVFAYTVGRPALMDTLRVVSLVTEPNVLRAIALVGAVVLWRRGRSTAAGWLVVTMAVGGLLSVVLKEAVQRARPELADAPMAGGYSFPSGHALNSMLFATCALVLLHRYTSGGRRVLLWALSALFVLLVGYDRVGLGVHYISDVLAGWVVALATVAASLAAFGVRLSAPGETLAEADDEAPGERHPGDRADGDDDFDLFTPAQERARSAGLSAASVAAPPAPAGHPGRRGTVGEVAVQLVPGWIAIWVVVTGLGLLVTQTVAGMWPLTVEDAMNRGLEAARTPLGNAVSFVMSELGNTATIIALCVVAAAALRRWLGRWLESVFVVLCTLGQSLVFFFTTLVIDRERPDVVQLDESPPTSSFPSGHTSASIALYGSLAVVVHRRVQRPWLRRLLVVLLVSAPVMVGVARLYRGMHHPSDLVGALVNSSLVILVTYQALRSAGAEVGGAGARRPTRASPPTGGSPTTPASGQNSGGRAGVSPEN